MAQYMTRHSSVKDSSYDALAGAVWSAACTRAVAISGKLSGPRQVTQAALLIAWKQNTTYKTRFSNEY
eukprot:1207478-Amphidinium_carterae.3